MRNRSLTSAIFAGAASLAVVTGVAWACTPVTTISSISSQAGPAGSDLIVLGHNPAEPVDLRWNSESGPTLATLPKGEFSLRVKVPEAAPPGVYYLLAGDRALETFEVRGTAQADAASSPASAGDLWGGFDSSLNAHVEDAAGAAAADRPVLFAAGLGIVFAGVSALAMAVLTRKRGVSFSAKR